MTNENKKTNISDKWQQILIEAVNTPGLISQAYSLFYSYSVGNQILALVQCFGRGIAPSPINTYKGWLALGRQVRRGEKAIELCQPITVKDKRENKDAGGEKAVFTMFTFKSSWFALSQTDGATVDFGGTPEWNKQIALDALGITEKPFDLTNGNIQGYAKEKTFTVSPIAFLPHKTTFHELAHIVLGHTSETALTDDERTPKNLREVEAESVALILCETLGLDGSQYARGYVQSWLGAAGEIPAQSAQRIFAAADKILKAGTH